MYGREEKCMHSSGGEICGKEATWEDLGIDGKIVLKWILKKWNGRHDS
jgi:hypothetical protein